MIQIDRNPADRSCEPARTLPATDLQPHPRVSTLTANDQRLTERPPLFVVPPPQKVWPRVFPGL